MLLLVLASLLLEPAVTTDGKLIIVPYVAGDGARGAENYELRTYNRNGTLVATHVVRTVDDEDGAPVIAKRQTRVERYLSTLHLRALPVTSTAPVVLGDDGMLRVKPRGHAVITRGHWPVTPSPEMQRALDTAVDDTVCFNPAKLGEVWFDAKKRIAVVTIAFSGDDRCWEPDSDVVVVAW